MMLCNFLPVMLFAVVAGSTFRKSIRRRAATDLVLASFEDDWIKSSQYHALYQFFLSARMDSASSRHLHNWFVDGYIGHGHDNYCSFTGVTCDNESYVIALDLNQTGLSGTLYSLHELTRLYRLRISSNALNGPVPDGIWILPALRHLNLGYNSISGSLPQFPNSSSLERLVLERNAISGTIPESICNLQKLTSLELADNTKMWGTLPECLSNLSTLKRLRVENMGLVGTIPMGLCHLPEMNGLVPNPFGCDAIACGPGYFQRAVGRQRNNETPCELCHVPSNVIGSKTCRWNRDSHPSEIPLRSFMPSPSPSDLNAVVVLPLPSSGFPSPSPTLSPSQIHITTEWPSLGPKTPTSSKSPSTPPSASIDGILSPDRNIINDRHKREVFISSLIIAVVVVALIAVVIKERRNAARRRNALPLSDTEQHEFDDEGAIRAFKHSTKSKSCHPELREVVFETSNAPLATVEECPEEALGPEVLHKDDMLPSVINRKPSILRPPSIAHRFRSESMIHAPSLRKVRFTVAEEPTLWPTISVVEPERKHGKASLWPDWILNPFFDPGALCASTNASAHLDHGDSDSEATVSSMAPSIPNDDGMSLDVFVGIEDAQHDLYGHISQCVSGTQDSLEGREVYSVVLNEVGERRAESGAPSRRPKSSPSKDVNGDRRHLGTDGIALDLVEI